MTIDLYDFTSDYFKKQSEIVLNISIPILSSILTKIECAVRAKKTIYICGNGGSMCSAMHFAEDMVKCVREASGKKVKCIALAANIGQITCLSNDFDYNEIFKYEVESFVQPGDVVIGLSVSGTSRNVIKALDTANDLKAHTILITGNTCQLSPAKIVLTVDDNHFGRVEDTSMSILHMIVNFLSERLKDD